MNTVNQGNIDYIEEDEIDLRELFATIMKGKKIIAAFVVLITTLTLIYVLSLPNSYKSEAVLIPTAQDSGSSLGSLGGLAAMAGVSLGGGGSMTPDTAFNSLLNNYEFMKKFVEKNKIVEHYDALDLDKNYIFALGYRGLYDMFKSSPKKSEEKDYEAKVFNTIKTLQKNFSISSDKKTALISVSFSDYDRAYPPVVIHEFLEDASAYLVENNLDITNKKLKYFEKELLKAESFELRQSLSGMISKILQEKVMMKSKVYYQCDVLTQPFPSYIKDKTKPKRALIMVVSFVTSIILGVFLVFFLEFIRGQKEEGDVSE